MNLFSRLTKYVCLVSFSLMFASSSVLADDTADWTSASGSAWVDKDGDCWNSATAGSGACGGAPEPMMEETTGYFWPDDSDFDGVPDANDKCWFTPEGVAVDADGCALDEDNDGVPDFRDNCLGTPAGTTVDINGCPILFTLTGIRFATNSARLTAADKVLIDNAMPAIKASGSLMLEVTGHTDSRGSSEYNQGLSERRAASVKEYLVSKGIASSRIETYGWGESRPVASNDTENGRSQNRRVEIHAK